MRIEVIEQSGWTHPPDLHIFYPLPSKGGKTSKTKSPLLRLCVATTAFGRWSRPTADEDGGAR